MSTKKNPLWVESFGNKSLHLILFITEQCNFRCIYCYEDFKLHNMEDDVVIGVKNLIESRVKNLQQLNLSFFGGEPLLNKKGVLEISNWAKDLCEKFSVVYEGNITTNGYSLDEKLFNKLIDSKVLSYQITIDGDKDHHDALRPTINGKTTFDKILSAFKMMANSKHLFICTVRLNLADTNFKSVESFVTKYAPIFANDKRFTFHFHPIFGMSELALTKKNQINQLQILAKSVGLLFDEVFDVEYVCYAAKANSFAIRADGKVQKCTVALTSDVNNVGYIDKDGSMNLDADKINKWIFAEDKGCPVHSLQLENLVVPYEKAGAFNKKKGEKLISNEVNK